MSPRKDVTGNRGDKKATLKLPHEMASRLQRVPHRSTPHQLLTQQGQTS